MRFFLYNRSTCAILCFQLLRFIVLCEDNIISYTVWLEGQGVDFTWSPGTTDLNLMVRAKARELGIDQETYCSNRCPEITERLRDYEAAYRLDDQGIHTAIPLKTGTRLHRFPFKQSGAMLAVHIGHDANIAMSIDGRVQCVLELERLFDQRYFSPSFDDGDDFRNQWIHAITVFSRNCICEDVQCPLHITNAAVVFDTTCSMDSPSLVVTVSRCRNNPNLERLMMLVEVVFTVEQWHIVDHHHSHAALGFYTSPFHSALVVTYDGGDWRDSFKVYAGLRDRLELLGHLTYNLGGAYNDFAALLPEITGKVVSQSSIDECVRTLADAANGTHGMAWPGKLMGYAAYGQRDDDMVLLAGYYYGLSRMGKRHSIPEKVKADLCGSAEKRKKFANSVQAAFEDHISSIIQYFLVHVGPKRIDGIVLSGGCALNVLANQRIYNDINGTHLQLYVPPAPNDAGLAVGALMIMQPPNVQQTNMQYAGFRLWDELNLDMVAHSRGARRLADLGGIGFLADLISGGSEWIQERIRNVSHPIVAVVRGRQEFGPRALGHRSLLAVPSDGMRERMNRLKVREWYRPVSPMIASEAVDMIFDHPVEAPYMELAPMVSKTVQDRFPSLAHVDGTARLQTVRRQDEPWIHRLLHSVAKKIGLAVLINTSFNVRGKPLVNKVADCIKLLDEEAELDYVIIEDWLFRSSS